MAFDAFKDSDESHDSGNDDQKDEGTHLYFGTSGYEKLPAAVTDSDEASDRVERAYWLAKSGHGTGPQGDVRAVASNMEGGIHRLLADFVITYGKVIDEGGDPQPFMTDIIGDFSEEAQAQAIVQHLKDNPEVGSLVAQALNDDSGGE